MISSVGRTAGYLGAVTAKPAGNISKATFAQALLIQQMKTDRFKASATGLDEAWLREVRSRYSLNNLTWRQGQSLVADLVGRGELSNDMLDLGARIIILFPPDAYDENGSLKTRDASDAVLLKMDEGYENTSDYIGTLKSSFEHQWEAYNGFVEKYGDMYPNVRNTLQEQDKLLGILQGMANA